MKPVTQKFLPAALGAFALMLTCCQTSNLSQETAETQLNATENTAHSKKTSSEAQSITCPVQTTLCPMIFEPALCELRANDGQILSVSGENMCTARLELLRKFCKSTTEVHKPFQVHIDCRKKE